MDKSKKQILNQINDSNLLAIQNGLKVTNSTKQLTELASALQDTASKLSDSGLVAAASALYKTVERINSLPKDISKVLTDADNSKIIESELRKVTASIKALKLDPQVNVATPKVQLNAPDFKPVIEALGKVEKAVNDSETPETKIDLEPVINGLQAVQDSIQALRFPVPNFELPFKNEAGKSSTVQLDSQGRIPIAGSLSGGGDGAILDGADSSIKATIFDYANSNPVGVVLRDSNGDYVSVGGGTQYTEDAVAAANPIGNALIVVREDGRAGSLTSADGDNIALRGNNLGELYVKHTDSIAVTGTFWQATQPVSGTVTANAGTNLNTSALALESGGNLATIAALSKAEDAAHSSGNTGIMALAVRNATVTDLSAGNTDGDYEPLQVSAAGRLWASATIDAALPAGTNAIGKLAANSGVDIGDVDVTTVGTITPGTAATSLGKAEDAAHASSDVGIMSLAVRSNTAASTSGSDGDYQPLITNTTGHLWVDASGQTLTVASHAVTNAGIFAVQATLAAETTKIIGAVNNLPATVDTNSGNKSASTLRVVLATDQPNLTTALNVNNSQVAGNTLSTGVGASGTGTQRTILANDNGKTILSTGGSAASSGNNTLVAAGTNKLKVKAFSLTTTSTTAMTCIFQSGASGTELWRVILQAPTGASTGANLSVNAPDWLFATAAATLLNLNLSSANAVHWSVSYYDEA